MTGTRTLLLWTGLLAAPLGWVFQLFVGYEAVEGGCASGGGTGDVFGVAADSAAVGITVAACIVAIAGALAAGWIWLAGSDAPAWARFLGFAGLVGSVLLLATILLAGAGIVTLDPCAQS